MKTPNDHIFRLIQAMSAAEKRYFKVHFASDDSLLTQLFDYLNQLSEYREAEIKKHFAKTSIAKNLKVYKVQLSEVILKSLAAFNHKKGLKDKLRIGIEEINALRNKQLFTIATNKINQLKKLATTHQQYQYLLHLLQIELEMSTYLLHAQPLTTLQTYQTVLQKLSTNHHLSELYGHLEAALSTHFFTALTLSQTKQIEAYHQQAENIIPTDFISTYYVNMVKAACCILLRRDYALAIKRYLVTIQQFNAESKFALDNVHPDLYWNVHYRLLQTYLTVERYAEAQTLLTHIQKWLTKQTELQYSTFYLLYLQIEMAYQRENYTKIEQIGKDFLAVLQPLKRVERYEVTKGLVFLTLICLQRKNFSQAQFYLRRLHGLAKNLPKVFSPFFDLLELLTHYSSQEIAMIQNLVTAYKRKQYPSEANSELFHDLIKAFQQLTAAEPTLIFDNAIITNQEDSFTLLYQHFALDRFIPFQFGTSK